MYNNSTFSNTNERFGDVDNDNTHYNEKYFNNMRNFNKTADDGVNNNINEDPNTCVTTSGPASRTVTGIRLPSSPKICVIPILVVSIAFFMLVPPLKSVAERPYQFGAAADVHPDGLSEHLVRPDFKPPELGLYLNPKDLYFSY